MPVNRSPVLDTPTSQEIVRSYSEGSLKLDAAWERRLPTIYRLMCAGLTANEITRIVGGDYYRVQSDIEAIRYLMSDVPDIERIRSDIAVEMDELYSQTIGVLRDGEKIPAGTKAKLIEQAREILVGKADLYGLRSATVNVNNNTRLLSLAAELRTLKDDDRPESEATVIDMETGRVSPVSTPETAA